MKSNIVSFINFNLILTKKNGFSSLVKRLIFRNERGSKRNIART